MNGHRIAARAAAALVALVAGAASYQHIASVALAAGEHPAVAYSLPVAIDGLIVVGVSALLEDKHAGLRPRAVARVAVLVGVVATLAANLASAQPTWTGRLVAVAAPVAFLLSVEVLTRSGKRRGAEVTTGVTPEPVAVIEQTTDTSAPAVTVKSQAESTPETPRKPAAPRKSSAARVVELSAKMPSASTSELAARLKLSEATVRRHRPRDSERVNGVDVLAGSKT